MVSPLLVIAGLVVVAALLWRLAGWSLAARRQRAFVAVAASVLVVCVALLLYGLYFSASAAARPRFQAEEWLSYPVLPLFLALPGAVCLLIAQLLRRAGISPLVAKLAAAGAGTASAAAAPLAALIAGCGLAGVCL